jgi:PEP-CTERM motif
MKSHWNWMLTGAVVVLAAALPASAGIVSINPYADGDGALICNGAIQYPPLVGGEYDTDVIQDAILGNIMGAALQLQGGKAHLITDVVTDTDLDPKVTMNNVIENDTSFAWTAFRVNFSMNKTFSLDSFNHTPTDWTYVYSAPVLVGSLYVATIDYTMPTGGTAIVPGSGAGSEISFGYRVTFAGSVSYTQEMIPIPEPATMSLLVLGGIAALIRRRNRA